MEACWSSRVHSGCWRSFRNKVGFSRSQTAASPTPVDRLRKASCFQPHRCSSTRFRVPGISLQTQQEVVTNTCPPSEAVSESEHEHETYWTRHLLTKQQSKSLSLNPETGQKQNRNKPVHVCFPAQMQQQELAQMRQRDANLTALAAIGPRKKRKLDSLGGVGASTEVRLQAGVTGLVVRPPARHMLSLATC